MESKKLKYFICLFFILITNSFAGKKTEGESFYDKVVVGERPNPLYSGPISPDGRFSPLTGDFLFLDDIHYDNYLTQNLERSLFELTDQWFNKFPLSSACPNFYLDQNLDYIRYLFRLITMSYLFEGMKSLNVSLHQLGFDRNACSISWHQTFSNCRPGSEDMKKFVERVQFRFLHDFDRSGYYRFSSKELQTWSKQMKKESRSKTSDDITRARLLAYCRSHNKDCDDLKKEEIRDALVASCTEDRELIQKICSESDQLYGLSHVDNLVKLLAGSNVMNVIDSGGHGASCLNRFINVFKEREKRDFYLSYFFPVIEKNLAKKQERYTQGSLFLPGALKEFDLKGLDNFLFTAPEIVEKPIEVQPAVVEVPIVATPAPEPVPMPVVVEEPVPEPEPTPIPEDRPSQFKIAYQELLKTNKERVLVNMQKFKGDFIFTDRMKTAMAGPIKQYQGREALEEMKKFDLIGSANEPIQLIFIKFLIDNNMHQGLFNVVAVLGDKFYVVNDIDGDSVPVLIALENSEKTKFRWQISLLRDRE